jgi:hypothetical protein
MTERGFREAVESLHRLLWINGFKLSFNDTLTVRFPFGIVIQFSRHRSDRWLCATLIGKSVAAVCSIIAESFTLLPRNGFNGTNEQWLVSVNEHERVGFVLDSVRSHLNAAQQQIMTLVHCLRAHGVCRDLRNVISRLAARNAELEGH